MKGKYASIEVTNFNPIFSLALLMENAFKKNAHNVNFIRGFKYT